MRTTVSAIVLVVLWSSFARAQAPASPKEVFDPARLHTIHLRIPADAWNILPPGGASHALAKAHPKDVRTIDGAASRYAYVRATVVFDDHPIAVVGVRLKGNSSYSVSASTPRKPFKIDFERFVDGQHFAGLSTLNLNNQAFDASQLRETFGFALFREMSVPAPRTGHALVYLTVPGVYDHEYLGLYTLIEEVDHKFLKRHFEKADGLLLKPGGMRGLVYYGDDWSAYKHRYNPKKSATPAQAKRIIDFARLVNRADDATFASQIDSYLDVDEFLRFVAVNSVITNFDSYLSTGHNYYLYCDARDGRIRFIPWDLNLAFGAYTWIGSPEETANTSITHAYADHNRLIERLLAIKGFAALYQSHVRRLIEGPFSPQTTRGRFETFAPIFQAAEAAARKANRAGSPTTRPTSGMGFGYVDFRTYIDRRVTSIRLQLDGKMPGYIPGFRDPMRVPAEWAPYTAAAVAMMTAADTDHDGRVDEAEVSAAITRLLYTAKLPPNGSLDRATATAAIERLLTDDMRRRTSAEAWSDWLFRTADANKDGKLDAGELLALYRRKLPGEDRDGDNMLDGRELLETLCGARAPADTQVHR
jgi:hypothetical protein